MLETPSLGLASRELSVMSSLIGALPLPVVGGRPSAGERSAFGQGKVREKPAIRTRVDHKNSEEAALVRRVQARDEMAFREIVERYQAKVFSIIYGILRNHNDAEDIAQQVFSKVYFSIRNFDFRSSLLTWIYKITVNECYDYLRKKRVRKLVYESDFSEKTPADGSVRSGGGSGRAHGSKTGTAGSGCEACSRRFPQRIEA